MRACFLFRFSRYIGFVHLLRGFITDFLFVFESYKVCFSSVLTISHVKFIWLAAFNFYSVVLMVHSPITFTFPFISPNIEKFSYLHSLTLPMASLLLIDVMSSMATLFPNPTARLLLFSIVHMTVTTFLNASIQICNHGIVNLNEEEYLEFGDQKILVKP